MRPVRINTGIHIDYTTRAFQHTANGDFRFTGNDKSTVGRTRPYETVHMNNRRYQQNQTTCFCEADVILRKEYICCGIDNDCRFIFVSLQTRVLHSIELFGDNIDCIRRINKAGNRHASCIGNNGYCFSVGNESIVYRLQLTDNTQNIDVATG